jgi:hypothetical protein
MYVYPSIAPNPFLSPSWNQYAQNAVYAIEHGLSSYGTPGTPAYYQRQTTAITPGEVVATSFNSWRGQAPPPAGYAGEFGNAILFGLYVSGGGQTFALGGLSYNENFFGSLDTFSFAGQAYGYDLAGVYYGPDRIPGTADDVRYGQGNPGNDGVPVDVIYFAGLGAMFWVDDPAALASTINQVLNNEPPSAAGAYSILIGGVPVSASGETYLIPEPGSASLLLVGLVGVLVWRRRKSAQR